MTCCLNLNFSIPYSLSLDVQSSQQVQFRLSENFCFSLELVFLLSELSLSVIKKKKSAKQSSSKEWFTPISEPPEPQSTCPAKQLVPKKKKKDQNCVCYLCGFRLVWQPVHDKTSASSFYKYSFARKHRNSWKIPRDIFGCLLISVHFSGRSYHGLLFSCRRGGFQQSQSHKVTLLSYLCCKFSLGLRRKFSSSSIQDGKPS